VPKKRHGITSALRGMSATTQLGLNLVPVVGPVLAEAIALYENERRKLHVDVFMAKVVAQLGFGRGAGFR
jgi:hypothetical protein